MFKNINTQRHKPSSQDHKPISQEHKNANEKKKLNTYWKNEGHSTQRISSPKFVYVLPQKSIIHSTKNCYPNTTFLIK